MTHKRYVKLLMSHGWERNQANVQAALVGGKGYSYQDSYDWGAGHWHEGRRLPKRRLKMLHLAFKAAFMNVSDSDTKE